MRFVKCMIDSLSKCKTNQLYFSDNSVTIGNHIYIYIYANVKILDLWLANIFIALKKLKHR
jgi:hypothetical protein